MTNVARPFSYGPPRSPVGRVSVPVPPQSAGDTQLIPAVGAGDVVDGLDSEDARVNGSDGDRSECDGAVAGAEAAEDTTSEVGSAASGIPAAGGATDGDTAGTEAQDTVSGAVDAESADESSVEDTDQPDAGGVAAPTASTGAGPTTGDAAASAAADEEAGARGETETVVEGDVDSGGAAGDDAADKKDEVPSAVERGAATDEIQRRLDAPGENDKDEPTDADSSESVEASRDVTESTSSEADEPVDLDGDAAETELERRDIAGPDVNVAAHGGAGDSVGAPAAFVAAAVVADPVAMTGNGRAAAGPRGVRSGATTVADEVVEKVALIAARQMTGVHALGSGAARLLGLDSPDPDKGLAVRVDGRNAMIAVTLVVEYGNRVYDVAQRLRDVIADAVESMVGVDVVSVDIVVEDVHIPE